MNIKWKNLNFYTKLIDKPGEDSYYALIEKQTECIIKRGETAEEAIKNSLELLNKKGEQQTKKAIKFILERTGNRKKLLSKKVRDKFYKYFNTSIIPFFHHIMGTNIVIFDIVVFDNWLRTPEGISTKDYITKKYGLKASKFIERLNKL